MVDDPNHLVPTLELEGVLILAGPELVCDSHGAGELVPVPVLGETSVAADLLLRAAADEDRLVRDLEE